jgi:TetR/AcrR family transcriptional regulator
VADDSLRRAGRPTNPRQREDLLATARQAFSELGYAGASMAEIAARAGIRKSSLFHHFASKDELYKEALSGHLGELAALMEETANEADTLKRIETTTAAIQRFYGAHPTAARLLVREFVDGTNAIVMGGALADQLYQASIGILQQAMDEGRIPQADARQLALSLTGIHMTYYAMPEITERLLGRSPFSPEAIEERTAAVVDHVRALIGAPALARDRTGR